ncbi:MAG: ACP S-malonyltransferase [Elusimicrobia bacterium]|nr:ACP S-malonyltransferase [Elusimicrobiota bacterium]
MVKNFALIFPGQGIQRVGMGKEIYEKFPQAKQTLDEACEILGRPLKQIMFEGPPEELSKIVNTQLSIFTLNIMILNSIKDALSRKPLFVAGHSLGEFCAVFASGALSFHDTLKLVEIRGTIMDAFTPEGSMAAVIGLPPEEVQEKAKEITSTGKLVEAVNFNSTKQTVISGTKEGIEEFKSKVKARVIPLRVRGPFHSSLMIGVEKKFQEELKKFYFSDPDVPVVSNYSANASKTSEEVVENLSRQIAAPVRWVDSVKFMVENGVHLFIESSEKSILLSMVKDIAPDVNCVNALSLISSGEK